MSKWTVTFEIDGEKKCSNCMMLTVYSELSDDQGTQDAIKMREFAHKCFTEFKK